MSTTTDAQGLLRQIEQFIADSHALLDQGAMLELTDLDKRVVHLCDYVMKLSPQDRMNYADHLQTVFDGLTRLGDALAQHRDATANEIHSLSQHKKATVAYRNVNGGNHNEKEE